MSTVGYWRHETTGVLRPAINAYLAGSPMSQEQIAAMRAYLRQWVAAPQWRGNKVFELRGRIDKLTTSLAITQWLDDACESGIDPI